MLRSDQAVLTELGTAGAVLQAPVLWGRKMGNQFAQVNCVELRLC